MKQKKISLRTLLHNTHPPLYVQCQHACKKTRQVLFLACLPLLSTMFLFQAEEPNGLNALQFTFFYTNFPLTVESEHSQVDKVR